MNKKWTLLIFLVLIIPSVTAWSWETHKYFAHHALDNLFPNCTNKIDNASIYFDKYGLAEGKDYCYEICPLKGIQFSYYCSVVEDCPAREEASKLILAPYETKCDHASNLAGAIYYLSHTADIMYEIKNEDPFCRLAFEEKVSDGVLEHPGSFSIEHCCSDPPVCFHFNYTDLRAINNQISHILNISSPEAMKNERKDDVWMYVVVAAIIIIAAFIYNNHIKDKGILDSPVRQ